VKTIPGKEKIAFSEESDASHDRWTAHILIPRFFDNLLSDAISRTYKRCAIRLLQPDPDLQ